MNYLQCETVYLKELTTCLIKSLALLVEIKPSDPIEYLANLLKHYRRMNPLGIQGRQLRNVKTTANLTSFITPFPTAVINVSVHRDNEVAARGIIDNDQLFVHKEYLDQGQLEDLFDDEDLF